MLIENNDSLDALIREEKQRVALEFFEEAWNSASQEGIESSILASMAVTTALSQLCCADGELAVATLIDELPERLQAGQFIANRSVQ